MKLLADAICQSTRVDLRDARDLLVKPAINHSTKAPLAMLDRFVVVNAEEFLRALPDDMSEYKNMIEYPPLPLPQFYMEFQRSFEGWKKIKIGVLFRFFKASFFVSSVENGLVPFLFAEWDINSGAFACMDDGSIKLAESFRASFVLLSLAMTSPRAASTERVHRMSTRANRRMAQRGAPMHSHNLVTLKLPQPSSQRHESQRGDFLGTVREHWVRGHWRLIINTTEPYFVWVDGHKAGNEAMGTVTKTHLVSVGHTASRKGMTVPSHTGKKGERVAAH